MKVFTIIITVLAIALIVFNATKVNLDTPFEGESVVALILIFASLCVIILLQILRLSKAVVKKTKYKN